MSFTHIESQAFLDTRKNILNRSSKPPFWAKTLICSRRRLGSANDFRRHYF